MIRKFETQDLDAVMQIWLEGNLDAHPFILSAFTLILFVGIIHDHARLFHKFRIIHEKPLLSILYYAPANSN